MNYITLKEAAKATGLNEMTIRRLCKKVDSKPYVRLKEGKNGSLYTIQTNYLFDKYPPKQALDKIQLDTLDIPVSIEPIQGNTQDYTPVLAVKDELIQVLKDEIAYLREENKGLREENKELKLLPAAYNIIQESSQNPKSHFGSGFGINSSNILHIFVYQKMYIMAIIETTSRQFRERQKDFFELADKGEKVVIRRGRKQTYVLTPISENDLYLSPEMIQRIKESQQEIKEGKSVSFNSVDEMDKYFQALTKEKRED